MALLHRNCFTRFVSRCTILAGVTLWLVLVGLVDIAKAADDNIDCVARQISVPTLESYRKDIEGILGPDSALLNDARTQGVLDREISRFLAQKKPPRDIFCILGKDVKSLDGIQYDTGGGQFIVFAAPDFKIAQIQSDAYSVVYTRFGSVVRESVFDFIEIGLRLPILMSAAVCPSEYEDPYGAMDCWRLYNETENALTAKYSSDLSKYTFNGGQIAHFDSVVDDSSEIGAQLNRFVFASVTHEFINEANYEYYSDSSSAAKKPYLININSNALDLENIHTVRQWLSNLSVENLRSASYRVAISLSDMLRDSTPEAIRKPGSRRLSIYAQMVSPTEQKSTEDAFSQFLCQTAYTDALGDNQVAFDLYRLASYQDMLCGYASEEGTALFVAERVSQTSFGDLLVALQALQTDVNNDELLQALNGLKQVSLDQTLLLNDLKEFAATDTFERKLRELSEQIQALEDKAKKQNILAIGKAVGGLVSAGAAIYGGGDGLLALWKELPGTAPGAIDFFKANKDEFKKSGNEFSDGMGKLQASLDTLDELFADYGDEIAELKAQKKAVDEKFRLVLADIAALRIKYYKKIDQAVSEAQSLSQANNLQTARVATNLGDIIGFVALANAGASNPLSNPLICTEALKLGLVDGGKDYLPELLAGCLKITNQVTATQACIGTAGSDEQGLVTIVASFDRRSGIRLATGDRVGCFSSAR